MELNNQAHRSQNTLYNQPTSFKTLPLRHSCFQPPLVLDDAVRRENSPPICIRVYYGPATYDAAGIQNGITTNIGIVTQQSAEFAQAGVKYATVNLHANVAGNQFKVGNLDTCTQVCPMPED